MVVFDKQHVVGPKILIENILQTSRILLSTYIQYNLDFAKSIKDVETYS